MHATSRDRVLKFVCHAGRWIMCAWTVTTLIALIKIVVDKKKSKFTTTNVTIGENEYAIPCREI